MGYRHYFYLVPLSEIVAARTMTMADIEAIEHVEPESYDYKSYLRDQLTPSKREIYEFGKLYWCDTEKQIRQHCEPLFTDAEVQKLYDDYNPGVCGPEAVKAAIECSRKKVMAWIEEREKDTDEAFVKEMRSDLVWKRHIFTDLEPRANEVHSDYLYEYSIANLYHILKSTNWDEYRLVFLGH